MYIKKKDKEYIETIMPGIDATPEPEDFEEFCLDCFNNYRLFYVKEKNIYHCRCERCDSLFTTEKLKDVKTCPYCHTKLTATTFSSDKENLKFAEECAFIQKLNDDQLVMRKFYVKRQTNYIFDSIEYERVVFDNNFTNERYFARYYVNYFLGATRWEPRRSFPHKESFLHPQNTKYLTSDKYKYSQFNEISKNVRINPFEFAKTFLEVPQIEYLAKLKMFNLIKDILKDSFPKNLTLNSDNIYTFLQIDKKQFDFAKSINANMEQLQILKFMKRNNIELTLQNFKACKTIFFNYYYAPESLNEISDKYISIKSLFEYAKNQRYKQYFIHDYYDYIKNCEILKRNLSDTKWLKPKDFKVAHDQAYAFAQSRKNKILDSAVKTILKDYICLNYIDKTYSVLVPKTGAEIRKEGVNQKNCVGGYVERVKNKTSIICFIRHTDELKKSFYTLELDPKTLNIVQCRGYHNNPTKEEKQVQAFVRKWQKEIVLKQLKKVS